MDNKSINTLEELQEAKLKLRQEMNISRHELLRTLEMTRAQAKTYFWRGFALPASLLGLGAVGVRVARNSFKNQIEETVQDFETEAPAENGISSKWYIKLLPVAINLVQQFLANRQNYQMSDEEDEELYNESSSYQAAQSVPARENFEDRMY